MGNKGPGRISEARGGGRSVGMVDPQDLWLPFPSGLTRFNPGLKLSLINGILDYPKIKITPVHRFYE